MTPQEISDFCIANAGKKAKGVVKWPNGSAAEVEGRITAFTNKKIVLEQHDGAKKKLPVPLPSIPYRVDGVNNVISPCNIGYPCEADTVVLLDSASIEVPAQIQTKVIKAQAIIEAKSKDAPCGHSVCDYSWCHVKYITSGLLNT